MSTQVNKKIEFKEFGGESFDLSFYASVFDVIDSHSDITTKDTFVKTIERFKEGYHSIDLRIEHESTFKTIGSITGLEIDEKGLVCYAKFHETPIGEKMHALCKEVYNEGKGEMSFSIGFITLRDSFREDGVRVLDDVELGEVSIVDYPSNPEAKIIEVKKKKDEQKRNLLINLLN